MPHLVWVLDASGEDSSGNAAWFEYTGRTSTSSSGGGNKNAAAASWLAWVHSEDASFAAALWQQTLHSASDLQLEARLKRHDGQYRWFLFSAQFHKSESDLDGHWYLTATDIHERYLARTQLSDSLEMHKKMLDVSVDCIKILNTNGNLTHMNLSGCRALGVSPDSGFGMKWLELLPPDIHAPGLRAFRQALRGGNARFSGKSVVPGKPAQYWDNILTPVLNDAGKTVSILCVSRDVTQQHEAQERLAMASEIDELTELPNRRAFKAALAPTLALARESAGIGALMLLDLDHFRLINDTLGHAAGDHLLQVVARRVQSCLPEKSFVARLGGDEFGIVLWGLRDEEELQRLAHRVMIQLDPPIHFSGKRINGGMSIGCAMYPDDSRDAAILMRCADAALHDMKISGRGGMRRYSKSIVRPLEQAAEQLEQARNIIRDGSLIPFYQPKVRLEDGELVGLEALMRVPNAELELQLPSSVKAAFHDYELATRIGEAMRAKVFKDIADWQSAGHALVPVSINAAPVEFMRDNYAEKLLQQVTKAGISPALLELEVTEQALEERSAAYVIRALKLLKHAGLRIALDDFGSGHSSLKRLQDLPVDCLKIDGDLVNNFGNEPAITAIVKAIGQFAPTISVDIIAEGVETETQRDMLLKAGYHVGQGFLFSPAVSAQEISKRLANAEIRFATT